MFVFDFLNAAAEIFCGIANWIVKPVCFWLIRGLQEFCKIPSEENEKLYKKQRNKCVAICKNVFEIISTK